MSDFFSNAFFPFGYFPAYWGEAGEDVPIIVEISATLSGSGGIEGDLVAVTQRSPPIQSKHSRDEYWVAIPRWKIVTSSGTATSESTATCRGASIARSGGLAVSEATAEAVGQLVIVGAAYAASEATAFSRSGSTSESGGTALSEATAICVGASIQSSGGTAIGESIATATAVAMQSSGGLAEAFSRSTAVGKARLGIAALERVGLVAVERPVSVIKPIKRAA